MSRVGELYGKLQAAKKRLAEFDEWYGLLDKRYEGGGGGYGEFHIGALSIYFQASSGAKNYHQTPFQFAAEFDVELKSAAREIAIHMKGALRREVEAAEREFGLACRELAGGGK